MWQALLLRLALLLAACPGASGHAFLVFPPMRGGVSGSSLNAYCPQCGNGAGICGDGGQWGASDMLGYTQGPMTTFSPGQVVEFMITVTAHHQGHFEFSICDQKIGHGTANAQACLDAHRLQRAPSPSDCVPNDARGDCQPVHAEYPERWYLPPGTGTYTMRFLIPSDLQCAACTLQYRWWTANSCIPAPDYGCYFSRMAQLGWDTPSWCGTYCGTCGSSMLQANRSKADRRLTQSTSTGCGEEFRNCADIAVLGSGVQAPTPTPPAPTPPSPALPAPSPPPAQGGACKRNTDCSVNDWCLQESYDAWCAAEGAEGNCPLPQCMRAGAEPVSTTEAPTTTPSPTGVPVTSPVPSTASPSGPPVECVSQSVLACINDYSNYWPKCSPGQAKSNSGPGGYEFGHYCTQEWTDALNEVLADPVVDKCSDTEVIRRFLAQVAYETGYYSTVYQPADGGAGLIHMIPGNWQVNAKDMDSLWPGQDYAGKAAPMGKDFFQTAAYGWRSVAAWFKTTNKVIGGCGLDLFEQSYEMQTKCILSRVVDRQEAYNVVSSCMAASATQAPGAVTTSSPASPATTSVATASTTRIPATSAATATTAAPASTSMSGDAMACVPIGDCGAHGWCDQEKYTAHCAAHSGAAGQCPPVFCKEESMPEPEPEPEPEHEPEVAPTTVQPSSTWAPVVNSSSSETACLPTNSAYSLYCAEQSAGGSCPSPWCEPGVAALQAGRARQANARRHSFLGTALIQEGASLERWAAPSKEIQEEL